MKEDNRSLVIEMVGAEKPRDLDARLERVLTAHGIDVKVKLDCDHARGSMGAGKAEVDRWDEDKLDLINAALKEEFGNVKVKLRLIEPDEANDLMDSIEDHVKRGQHDYSAYRKARAYGKVGTPPLNRWAKDQIKDFLTDMMMAQATAFEIVLDPIKMDAMTPALRESFVVNTILACAAIDIWGEVIGNADSDTDDANKARGMFHAHAEIINEAQMLLAPLEKFWGMNERAESGLGSRGAAERYAKKHVSEAMAMTGPSIEAITTINALRAILKKPRPLSHSVPGYIKAMVKLRDEAEFFKNMDRSED